MSRRKTYSVAWNRRQNARARSRKFEGYSPDDDDARVCAKFRTNGVRARTRYPPILQRRDNLSNYPPRSLFLSALVFLIPPACADRLEFLRLSSRAGRAPLIKRIVVTPARAAESGERICRTVRKYSMSRLLALALLPRIGRSVSTA